MAHFFKKNFGNSKYEKFVNQTTFWVSNQNDLAIFLERIWSHWLTNTQIKWLSEFLEAEKDLKC